MIASQELEPAPVRTAPRGSRWLLLLVLLLVFVSGGIVGGGSTDYLHRKGWTHLMLRPSEVPDRLVPMLRGKLELSDEQTGKVDQIVRQRHHEIEKLRAEVQPRIDRQIEQMQAEIDGVLEPEQRERWHDWVQSLRRRWGPDHHPRHHGPRSSHGPSHGHEGEAGWAERRARHAKSKDATGANAPPAGAAETPAAGKQGDEKPGDDKPSGAPATKKPATENDAAAAPAAEPAAPAGNVAALDGTAATAQDKPVDPVGEPTAPPAKTDP